MRIYVEGRQPLNGQYQPGGNANAAVALLAASLLTPQPVTLRNVPRTSGVQAMLSVAERLGSSLSWTDQQTLTIQTEQLGRRVLSEQDINGYVAALLFLASLLLRRQHARAEIDFPLNRIRTHLQALRDLGIEVVTNNGAVECSVANWERKEIILTQASVTATALVMMLAACLGKETTIYNAACEPHVQELAHLLASMGVRLEGVGSNLVRVFGTTELQGAEVTVGPDHIEAASIAAIAAICGGRLQIEGVRGVDLRMVDKVYQRLGIELDVDDDALFVPKHDMLSCSNREEDKDSSIETAPWPGFPSDLVAMATVTATQARGTSLIHEKLFPNRLLFVDKLKAMGAQIILCDPHRAIVVGPTPLQAIYMDTPDVRTGLGMLAAALVAEGESTIDNAQAIERTFTGVLGKLQTLGAKIRIEVIQTFG